MTTTTPGKRYLVTKSNDLIMARYDLSLAEQRLIVEVASMVSPGDEEFKDYDVSVADYVRLVDSSAKNEYQRMKDLADSILKKPLFIKKDNGGFVGLNWFSSIEYKPNDGVLQCHFDEKLKPFLLQLKKKFTSYQLENVLRLKSKYAIRIYEILKSKSKLGTFEIELDELRKLIAIPNSYRWDDIKKQVLNPAKKALKVTDLSFDYEPIKRSRRVHKIKFFITENPQQLLNLGTPNESDQDNKPAQPEPKNLGKLLNLVPDQHRRAVLKIVRDVLNNHTQNYVAAQIKYTMQQHNLKNFAGFLRQALADDYAGYDVQVTAERERIAAEKRAADAAVAVEKRQRQEEVEVEKLWAALSDDEREKFINQTIETIPFLKNLGSHVAVIGAAKALAYDESSSSQPSK